MHEVGLPRKSNRQLHRPLRELADAFLGLPRSGMPIHIDGSRTQSAYSTQGSPLVNNPLEQEQLALHLSEFLIFLSRCKFNKNVFSFFKAYCWKAAPAVKLGSG